MVSSIINDRIFLSTEPIDGTLTDTTSPNQIGPGKSLKAKTVKRTLY